MFIGRGLFIFGLLFFSNAFVYGSYVVDVYKSISCSCCSKWVTYLKQNGYEVNSHNVSDLTSIKKKAQLPSAMRSCHTAYVEGYVVEGHVFVEDIERMLLNKPAILGIITPGMPIGTPGMERGEEKMPHTTYGYNAMGDVFEFSVR